MNLAVFCHELAHLTQRHLSRLYKSQKDSSDVMLLTLLSAIILGVTEPDVIVGTLSLGQTLALKKQMSFLDTPKMRLIKKVSSIWKNHL